MCESYNSTPVDVIRVIHFPSGDQPACQMKPVPHSDNFVMFSMLLSEITSTGWGMGVVVEVGFGVVVGVWVGMGVMVDVSVAVSRVGSVGEAEVTVAATLLAGMIDGIGDGLGVQEVMKIRRSRCMKALCTISK